MHLLRERTLSIVSNWPILIQWLQQQRLNRQNATGVTRGKQIYKCCRRACKAKAHGTNEEGCKDRGNNQNMNYYVYLSIYYPIIIHLSIDPSMCIYIYIVLCIYIHSLITDGKTCCICFSAPEGDQQTCPYLGQIPEGAATCRNCTPQELLPSSSSTYTFLNPQAKVRAM